MRRFKTVTGRSVDVHFPLEYDVLLRHDLEFGGNCTPGIKMKIRRAGHDVVEPEGTWVRCIRRGRHIVVWGLTLTGDLMRVDAINAFRKGRYGLLVVGIVNYGLTHYGDRPEGIGTGVNIRWKFDDILGVFTYDANVYRRDRMMVRTGLLDFRPVDEETQEIH